MAMFKRFAAVPAVLALFAAGVVSAQTTGSGAGGGPNSPGTTQSPGARSGSTQQTPSDAPATTRRSGATDKAGSLSRADAAFLRQAAENGLAEVESSKIAAEKASSPEVKKFAQHMIDEHTKANEELKSLASSKGVEVPANPSVAQRGKLKMLSTADGATFDRRYAESMGVEAHRDTIALFEKAAKGAQDSDVKAFAQKTLPHLREHLKMAQALPMSGAAASGSSRSGTSSDTAGTRGRKGSPDSAGATGQEGGGSGPGSQSGSSGTTGSPQKPTDKK
jgi:putative membrane protein